MQVMEYFLQHILASVPSCSRLAVNPELVPVWPSAASVIRHLKTPQKKLRDLLTWFFTAHLLMSLKFLHLCFVLKSGNADGLS